MYSYVPLRGSNKYKKKITIYNLPNIKFLLSPTLSQRWSLNNLVPGVPAVIFNYVWVPKALLGRRRLE